jgi:hypothetical protein
MHVTTSFAVKALTLVLAAGSAQAFWRMPCRSRSGLARLDPLVSPGTVSQHAHAIHGSSGTSLLPPSPRLLLPLPPFLSRKRTVTNRFGAED